MSADGTPVPARAMGVHVTNEPEGLSHIHKPGCAATVWKRTPLPVFQSWIDALSPEHLPKARLILRPEYVRDALTKLTCTCGTPDCAEQSMLVDDAAALSMIFAKITRAPFLRLRLDLATGATGDDFEIDEVKARLVCAYRGPELNLRASPDEAVSDRVVRVPTGAPIVLRGGLWPDPRDAGQSHQPVPIKSAGEDRFTLVLDPVVDPEPVSDSTFIH
ncbi:MAG: DUF1826 domain-containing protein [Pseudomonadota bacterium]